MHSAAASSAPPPLFRWILSKLQPTSRYCTALVISPAFLSDGSTWHPSHPSSRLFPQLGQIRQQRARAGEPLDVTKSFTPPRNRNNGYSQLKKTADKIYAFDDLRTTAAPAKDAKQPPQLFPDRTLPPMAALPVSLQPPYFPCAPILHPSSWHTLSLPCVSF
jgi:hypothetical protein